MSENIVGDWLRSLRLAQYAESFLDNGYDDLEICKQIGEPDLDAIGVGNPAHRAELLRAVRVLREQGGTAVYFTLEEAQQQQQQLQSVAAAAAAAGEVAALVKEPLPPNYSTYMYDDDLALVAKTRAAGNSDLLSPTDAAAGLEPSLFRKYVDEYEEGKAELAKIPRLQLKGLLRERLVQDGVRLSSPPYSNADGSKGYLDGLAVKYAEEFKTVYQDIVEHLESLRRKEVEEAMSTQVKLAPTVESVYQVSSCHSSPIYKPGKYSPSSCLSDQEEEEIYGYGYGVYARRIYKHRANRLACIATPQRCINPRNQCFYEPCSFNSATELKEVEPSSEPTKKRGPLGRILRGLVLKREKEKNKKEEKNNPRHLTPTKSLPPRIPDPSGSPLYEGLYATREMRAAAEERMKLVLMVKDGQISMEQAFDKMCQYEPLRWKNSAQDTEILKDFRHGVLNNITPKKSEAKETAKFYTTVDTSYPHGARLNQHWYDDPPYESDLDESGPYSLRNPKTSISMPYVETSGFPNGSCLRGGDGQPPSSWIYSGDSVIMTRTAGDIQVARDQIRPKSCESRLSDGIRLSNASAETSASSSSKRESLKSAKDDGGASSPAEARKNKSNSKFKNPTSKQQSASEEALSLSSDYEDQEDSERKTERRLSRDLNGRASSFVGRMKGFGNDVKKKISKLRPSRTASESEAADASANVETTITTSASSVESIPSGSGSSIQALTTSSSNRSSTSVEEETPAYTGPFIGKARALVDYTPSPYDKDALKFKKGDVIDIITMSQTGSWTGMLNNRVGHFKFINVEAIPEPKPRPRRSLLPRRRNSKRGKPKSVEELLQRINLEEHISVFVLNGYENLDLFKELEEEDLDYLGITDSEHRAKILTAVELLHDYDSPDSPDADEEPMTDGESYPDQSDASKLSGDSVLVHKPPHSPRDSGCYASNENLPHRESLQQGTTHTGSGDISQSESGIHSSDGMDGLTPAPPNNLDSRETGLLPLGSDKRLFHDSTEMDGNTLVTRAVIENVSKHSYQPNILPNTICLQAEDTLSCSLLNGPTEVETSLGGKYAPKMKSELSNNSVLRHLHMNSVGKNDDDWEHSQSSSSPDPTRFCGENSDVTLALHQSTASPTLLRDHASQNLRSLDPDLTYALSNASISHGSLKGGRLNPSCHPAAFVHQGTSDGAPSSPKSATMPIKQGTPSKIKIPHLPTQLNSKKLIAFKEPSVMPKKGRTVTLRTPRPASSSLDMLLQRKLQEEMIDLSQEPYTDRMGFCGIPPALVQRYSEETKCDVKEIADTLDHIRISHLQQLGRQGVPNDFLADSCFCPMQEADYMSLESWLVSVGLPMYTELLCCAGHTRLGDIVHLKESDLRACGISNALHLRRLVTEIEALNIHLQKFAC